MRLQERKKQGETEECPIGDKAVSLPSGGGAHTGGLATGALAELGTDTPKETGIRSTAAYSGEKCMHGCDY